VSHSAWLSPAETGLRPQVAHGGPGEVLAARALARAEGGLAFVDFVVVPPGVAVGRHTHGQDEELYIIIDGCAEVVVDDEQRTVRSGDVVHNRAGGTHELRNDGPDPLRMVVVDVRTGQEPAEP
jgi:mannose-6-phosphate isomerase-like protein (cupin superfamily)